MKSSFNTNTILLLDNEYDNLGLFMLALRVWGFDVVGFTEPLLALEHFQKNSENYRLVITDINMPVMNGYQFIKEVKEIKPQVKVFFMSAFDTDHPQFRVELPFVEIDEFIQKPILLEDFARAVSRHISS